MSAQLQLRCTICDEPAFPLLKNYVKHLRNVHLKEDESGGKVDCPFGCPDKYFSKPSALSQHLSKFHPKWGDEPRLLPSLPAPVPPIMPSSSQAHSQIQTQANNCSISNNNIVHQEDPHAIAKFYLSLEAKHLIPTVSVQRVFRGVIDLSNLSHESIAQTLRLQLRGRLPDNDIDDIIYKVRYNDPVYTSHHKEAPGLDLSTDYMRKLFYTNNYQFQEPVEYLVGKDPTKTDFKVAFVHIKRSLELLLADPSVQKQVDASFKEDASSSTRFYGTVIRNYTDGSAYKKKVAETGRSKKFDIILFQDGFNPTSSSSRLHDRYKTNGMYFILGNIIAKNRSKLSSLRLVMLVFEHVLKEHREECFDFVIKELTDLYDNGVMYKGECIPVELQIVTGDNAGQHMLGGFLEGFNPFVEFACRYCEISSTEYHKTPWLLKPFRTPETYSNCLKELVDMVENLKSSGKFRSEKTYSVKGIKRNSEFNKVPAFHVCDPPLAPCIGHDGFGGTWEYDMAQYISYFVHVQQWFDYEFLKQRMLDFKFCGTDATNVPAQVSQSQEKLGGNEVQNWTLIRLFPLFVGDKIEDVENVVWQLYLKLRIIIEMVCAPQLTLEQICNLKHYTTQYLRERCHDDFPIQMKVTIKTHITAHFADLYEILGPLFHVATFRFESKHAVLSRIIDLAKTHVNVIATMGKKDQLHMSYLTTEEMYSNKLRLLKSTPMVLEKYKIEIQSVLKKRVFTPKALDVNTVHLHGQEFHRDNWLLLSKTNGTMNVGKICSIISDGKDDKSDIFFVLEVHPSSPLENLGLYEIQDKCRYEVMLYSEHLPIIGQAVYEFQDRLCFSLKYCLVEENTCQSVG